MAGNANSSSSDHADGTHDELVEFDASEHPHRRYNPLTRSWVLCSPHRTKRPWQGQEEKPQGTSLPAYDEKCYLCPRNTRATGATNDDYTSTFFFENDYAALIPQAVAAEKGQHPLLQSQPARGRCYVICFHPQHNLTLAQLSTPPFTPEQHIVPIIEAWQKIYRQIPAENPFVKYIQIFENKGAAMGCSNPHPHGQVWSLDYIPEEPSKELAAQCDWSRDPANQDANVNLGALDAHGRPSMLLTLAKLELSTPGQPRVIASNDHFVALVPYWAVWPFEVLLLPAHRQICHILDMDPAEVAALARILAQTTCMLDNLFKCSFPYSMGVHQQPTQTSVGEHDEYAQFHVHFYPPLLRSASVRKFLVGFEMMAEPQRDLTAEQAASRIRECGDVHYLATMDKE
ncbi:probable GAL7-UDP-glucose--hexose-1-phosphate uridylyltransferase [Sporisorium reilianum SRZ2]|uniref:Galactose-1-phosphate uridylyltransferase n=1 Tax=Sporisorium reilianum (strain SRZ2) TaxID=999809 RepID=E6ZXZ7_SPORE|nr:probable GAL7-UDP-glucose--hexose-1-phosphate uridylyltransferase [Sporisorium reilianum SRZ2]